jgi:hypothetical protein
MKLGKLGLRYSQGFKALDGRDSFVFPEVTTPTKEDPRLAIDITRGICISMPRAPDHERLIGFSWVHDKTVLKSLGSRKGKLHRVIPQKRSWSRSQSLRANPFAEFKGVAKNLQPHSILPPKRGALYHDVIKSFMVVAFRVTPVFKRSYFGLNFAHDFGFLNRKSEDRPNQGQLFSRTDCTHADTAEGNLSTLLLLQQAHQGKRHISFAPKKYRLHFFREKIEYPKRPRTVIFCQFFLSLRLD